MFWSLVAGPVSIILIAAKFTPEIQGYYYTFSSLLAMRVLMELGLGTVIIQFASHEWAKLSLDETGHIVGDKDSLSRLTSIAGIAFKWYMGCGALVAVGLGLAGFIFFSGSQSPGVNWVLPWFALCFLTGITVSLVPIWSLLEGCNQVARLNYFRFFQGLLVSVSTWGAMLSGAELWTAAISSFAALLVAVFFLRRRYWIFVRMLMHSRPEGPRIDWRNDMLPMQWRIAASFVGGYFIYFLFVPVLFKYHGAVVAGQMGMTWAIASISVQTSGAWVSPRAPQFGILIALKKYDELDRQFWKLTKVVSVISLFTTVIIWSFVLFMNVSDYGLAQRFASRMLPPLPFGLFLLAQLLPASISATSIYLRAHKKEPLMVFSIVFGVAVGISTYFLGKYYSAIGMASGYMLLNLIGMPIVILIWNRCRKEWHKPEIQK